jgi:hypothetical protein
VAYYAAGWVADYFQLAPATKTILFFSLTAALFSSFFVGWRFTWLIDVLLDHPLPGHSEHAANALLRVATEYLPRLPWPATQNLIQRL